MHEVYIMGGFFKKLLNRNTDDDYEEMDEVTEEDEIEEEVKA